MKTHAPRDAKTARRSTPAQPGARSAAAAAHTAASDRARLGSLLRPEDPPASALEIAAKGVANADAPLPHLERIQRSFGEHDLGAVRTTVSPAAPDELDARAYTLGERIAFERSPDLRLAAHEAAHVVQQRAGVELADGVGQSRDRYEREADAVADAVVAGRPASAMLGAPVRRRAAGAAVQLDAKPAQDGERLTLSTATLLELALSRLDAIAQAGDGYARIAASELTETVRRHLSGELQEDPAILRQRALRLNGFLAANQSVFSIFPEMEKKESYLAGIADTVVAKVEGVSRKFAVSLQLAWRADAQRDIFEMAIAEADTALAELPEFITAQVLSREGLEREIASIRPELDRLMLLRSKAHGAPLRGRVAEQMIGLRMGQGGVDVAQAMNLKAALDAVRYARSNPGRIALDVQKALPNLNLLSQQVLGCIHTMQVYEQLDLYADELDSWINKGIEIFGKEIRQRIVDYRDEVDRILQTFEGDFTDPKVGPGRASPQRVQKGLKDLMDLMRRPAFRQALDLAEDRLKTVAVIRMVGKLIAITALAALGGIVAAQFVAAGAVGLGAAEGGLVASGAAFAGEVVAFTAISRAGQQLLFGDTQGSFAGDLAVNALTFGVLKSAQAGFTRAFKIFADPKLWKTSYALGRAGTGLLSLQLFSEAHYAATHKGKLMPGEERLRGVVQNVVLVVALEAGRFITEPLALRLSMPALRFRLAKRMDALAASHASLQGDYAKLKRGELSREAQLALTEAISKQWLGEIQVLAEARQKGIITEAELSAALANYVRAIGELELALSRINVEAPRLGQRAMFQTLESGIVRFDPSSDALQILQKFYRSKGGTLEPSKTLKDGFEGRLPDGELTFYLPEGIAAKDLPGAARIAAARDAAVRASNDELAAQGLARLSSVFKKLRVDEILAGVPADQMLPFLRMLADPTFSPDSMRSAGGEFFARTARSGKAIRFGRRYGLKLLNTLSRRYGEGREAEAAFDKALDEIDAHAAGDPEGTSTWREQLAQAKSVAEIEALLGREKAKTPRARPVRATKKSLPVERGDEWETQRSEVDKDAKAHGQNLTPEELDLRTDCEVFFAKAKNGDFKRFGRASKIKFLDAFDDVAKRSQMPQNHINAHRGNLSEALFNPEYGRTKDRFLRGRRVVGATPKGATIPDYPVKHDGFVEHVNQKSDLIDQGVKDGTGAFVSGKNAARLYLAKAKGDATSPGEATNLPAGDRYSLDFVRDPGAATQKAMLTILFGEGSPIFRVKFGDGEWQPNPRLK